jgi:hypothetical protein
VGLSGLLYGDFKGTVETNCKKSFKGTVAPDLILKYTNASLKKLHGLSGIKDFEDYFTSLPISVVSNTFSLSSIIQTVDRIKSAKSDILGRFNYFDPLTYDDNCNSPHYLYENFFTRKGNNLEFHPGTMLSRTLEYGNTVLYFYRFPYTITALTDEIDIKPDMIDNLTDMVSYKLLIHLDGKVPQYLDKSVGEILKLKDSTIEEKPAKIKKEISSE